MKGIKRRQHEALKQSLQQLEVLLIAQDCAYGNETTLQTLRVQQAISALEQSYLLYQKMLDALAFHIVDYEELYREVKVYRLGGNLRQLLRELPKDSPDKHLLKENINMAKAV